MTAVRNLGEAALAAMVAAGVAAVGLVAFGLVNWPAFNSSHQLRALTTVGQVVCLAVLATAVVFARRSAGCWFATLLTWVGLSGFVTVTLGLPLAASKLYLLGVSVDQEFRTEYLTRLTDSAALHDMTYADLPSFYPAGWFWIGGRIANLLGMSGWEVFKPFAIGTIAVAAAVASVLWTKLVRHDYAIVVALATTAMVVTYSSPEPYGAPIVVLLPPALLLAWGGLHRPTSSAAADIQTQAAGGWAAVVGTGLFLGFSATFYTLYTAFAAGTVVVMALCARAWVKLAAIAGIALAISLTVWAPFLLGLRQHSMAGSGTAFHYLPESGAHLPLPMLSLSWQGALCLVGTIWLVLRAASSRRAQALGIGVAAIYLWALASMAFTVFGTTLLSFRLEPILLTLLAAAGVFGFIDGAAHVPKRAALAVGAVGALAFSQNIPHVLVHEITTAYTDTDGNGHRADQREPSAVAHYREIDAAIGGGDKVVLTGDTSFLAFYPYYGFQARSSHYANPMANFQGRAADIDRWSKAATPAEFQAHLATSPWRTPDVFLFRSSGDAYTLRLAEDVYPNDPNVRRYTVEFPKTLFDPLHWTTKDIGPFTVVQRR